MNNKVEIRRAVCQFCQGRCRVLVHSENGHLVKIEEDKSFPRWDQLFPPTRACLRLHGAKEWMYHPDRVNFPLKRVGERGEAKWQRVSWDQALDEVAQKLLKIKNKYGAESIGVTTGTGRNDRELTNRFFHPLGSPNLAGAATICYGSAIALSSSLLGWSVRYMSSTGVDTGNRIRPITKCVMLIGASPSQSTPRLWKTVLDGKEIGVKLIVVDPRRTKEAELADLWLQLRPGTDTALLLSMINVIIKEGLYDRDFVEKWCFGFDEVAERALDYPPERVADICWLSPDKIREAARMFGENRPALAIAGMGVEHQQSAIEALQARTILSAIVGNIDVEGGDYMGGPSRLREAAEIELCRMLPAEQKAKQLGSDRFKLAAWPGRDLIQTYVKKVWGKEHSIAHNTALAHAPTLYRAILTGKPYPVKALITIASNPMVTQPNTRLVYQALKSLELYAVIDYWLTPSAELADYVFPCASWLERPFLSDGRGDDPAFYAGEATLPSAIPGEYEHKTDYEFLRGLAVRMGYGEYWPWQNLEEAFDNRLEPTGQSFNEFMGKGGYYFPPMEYKKYEKIGFATPTGKAELYSTIFEKLGYDPLPRYEESFENPISTPELAKEYPLMLITGGRFYPMFHSEHRNVDSMRRRHPHPLVQINPETARKLDIQDGKWVWIETPRGKIRMKCQYFAGIDPRVVHAEHGWWFPELPGEEPWLHGVWESNVNVLMDDDPEVCNKLNGGWPLRTSLCKVYKVKEY